MARDRLQGEQPGMMSDGPETEAQLEAQLEATNDDAGGDDTAPVASVELFDDFEQKLVVANARAALFGRPTSLRIGRYEVERRLGAGGMGEVYLARDDELGRPIAIKRVLTEASDPRDQRRLRREAQSLARLTHPNVVSVYEIGEHDGRLFMAMQYVEGQTLGAWLEAAPRTWREILACFVAAGRGLAAAHEADLVHRDFKPDNVLIGTGGDVLVADFGLALGSGSAIGTPSSGPAATHGADLEARLSVTGAIVGTLRFMPLEQLRGTKVDARSDQFSFCVALYEALWAGPPFALDSAMTRFEALERGAVLPPPRAAGVPPGLWRVIKRGLAREPSERWPSMDALLGALERVPRRRRIAAWSAPVLITVGAALLSPWARGPVPPPPSDPCAALERELDGVWDTDTRADLSARFRGDDPDAPPHLAASGERIVAGLDRWAEVWASERTKVCRAQEAGELSSERARLEDACLTRQRVRVDALVELLDASESPALARGVEAVLELPPPASCASDLALLGVEPPSASQREAVEAIRADLDRAIELRMLGRVDEALGLAQAASEAAEALAYAPVQAEALAELGKSELEAGSLERGLEQLREAVDLAEISHHDQLASLLWTELALRTLVALHDYEAGAELLRRARVAAERASSDAPRVAAKRALAEAELAAVRGESEVAATALRRALLISETAAPQDLPAYRSRLASLVAAGGDSEAELAALALRQDALADAERSFGPDHPQTALYSFKLGEALGLLDRRAEAQPALERAVDIWTRAHDQPHRDLARAELVLAEFAIESLDLDAAEAHIRALVSIQAQTLPAGHVEHGQPELLLALVHGLRSERDQALVHAEAAVTLWEPRLAPDDPRLVRARNELASHHLALGHLDQAAAEYARVIEHGDPGLARTASLALIELEIMAGHADRAAAQLDALDARISTGELELEDDAYTHALMGAIAALRLGRLESAQVEALRSIAAPFSSAQILAWLDELGLSARERAKLGFG